MTTIYALVGPPGSGKSFLARTMIRYMNAVIVSRDQLRMSLFGYKEDTLAAYYDLENVGELEKIITKFQDTMIKQTIVLNKDVILDNMNIDLRYIEELKRYNVPIKFVPMTTSLELAIERDRNRAKAVGEEVVRKYYKKYEEFQKKFDFKDWTPKPVEPLVIDGRGLPGVWVFDIDGTLALKGERSPYDYSRVSKDHPNEPVFRVYDALRYMGFDIIVCSGRPEKARRDTEDWLDYYGIKYERLYMRADGDNRKDYIVKEEMWRRIVKTYNIIGMFDDRNQVVEHARKLGFTVFQVADGNF